MASRDIPPNVHTHMLLAAAYLRSNQVSEAQTLLAQVFNEYTKAADIVAANVTPAIRLQSLLPLLLLCGWRQGKYATSLAVITHLAVHFDWRPEPRVYGDFLKNIISNTFNRQVLSCIINNSFNHFDRRIVFKRRIGLQSPPWLWTPALIIKRPRSRWTR